MRLSAEGFRALVERKIVSKVGVGLDDLPDVSLDDWLDGDDGIDRDEAEEAADDAVAAILEENGFEEDEG